MTFEIATPRVLIREWTDADYGTLRALVMDPRVMAYIGRGVVWNDQAIHAFLWRQDQAVMAYDYCIGPLIDQTSKRVIGVAGLQRIGSLPDPEMTLWLAQHAWGRGLGTEVAVAILTWGFEKKKLARILATVHPDNAAGIHVLEKASMRSEGLRRGEALNLAASEVVVYSADNPSPPRTPFR